MPIHPSMPKIELSEDLYKQLKYIDKTFIHGKSRYQKEYINLITQPDNPNIMFEKRQNEYKATLSVHGPSQIEVKHKLTVEKYNVVVDQINNKNHHPQLLKAYYDLGQQVISQLEDLHKNNTTLVLDSSVNSLTPIAKLAMTIEEAKIAKKSNENFEEKFDELVSTLKSMTTESDRMDHWRFEKLATEFIEK